MKVTYKPTCYAMVTLLERKKGKDVEVLGVYHVKEKEMAEAIEAGRFGDSLVEEEISEEALELYSPPHNVVKIPSLYIYADEVPTFLSKSRSVACCAYNATDSYMSHMLGMHLDSDDKKWYELNELVTGDGLPQRNSFTVIQQLIQPYGLGISRIFVPRNSRRFDEYVPFMFALGSNPFFMVDGHTTNEEALEKMQIPADKREFFLNQWRYECVDEAPSGSISMNQFNDKESGHNGGSNYYGPRRRVLKEGWRMSIKLDKLSNITYLKELALPEYKEYPGHMSYSWWGIKDDEGKTLRKLSDEVKEKNRGKFLPVKTGGSFDGSKVWAFPSVCEVCSKSPGEVDRSEFGAITCQWCGNKVREQYVSREMLSRGWTESKGDGGWGSKHTVKQGKSGDIDSSEGNVYDPYYWQEAFGWQDY